MRPLQRTPLHDFHAAHGARFVEFAGWEMPVQYRSILEEHRAVRSSVGLFDVSHMGEAEVAGSQAEQFLNFLVTNDVSRLYPGRVLYTPMCYPDGGVVDDLLVYRRGPDAFLLCFNAANAARDLAWMGEHAEGYDCVLADRSADYALLALQGPRSAEVLQALTPLQLADLKYYHCREGDVGGVACLVSRTGYTGEDGFEVFCDSGSALRLAEALMEAGSPAGMLLCGLGARDSLRLEAGYPLYGHEISEEISPLQAGLGWTVKLDKPSDFVGRAALQEQKQRGAAQRVVFFRTGDRRIVRPGSAVLDAEGAAGRVLSGTLSPMLNEAIGSALVRAGAGELHADVRGASIQLHLVKPPFVELKK